MVLIVCFNFEILVKPITGFGQIMSANHAKGNNCVKIGAHDEAVFWGSFRKGKHANKL